MLTAFGAVKRLRCKPWHGMMVTRLARYFCGMHLVPGSAAAVYEQSLP
jgi:hypothetical protein